MTTKPNNPEQHTLSGLSPKEIMAVKKDFGLTETELSYLLALAKNYRKNAIALTKKLVWN